MKRDTFRKEYRAFGFNRYTLAALIITLIAAVALAVYVGDGAGKLSRNWFWVLSGTLCLGVGITVYVYGLAKSGDLCMLMGAILLSLGAVWLVADIICDGMNGKVFGGWWIGALAGAGVMVVFFAIPEIIKHSIKKT